ncbi:protein CFAP276-like [Babylonia areolata]|uniref:protein CFAP276-like n=1 Tax=Babylonia areolata TaxID=304850 RepID=UPI003FD0210F
MATMSKRDPYPFPKLQNDENFYGSGAQQVAPKTNSWTVFKDSNEVYGVPTHLAQQQEPWKRLNSTHTLSSSRHEVYHFDPQAPRDSLDFVLKAKYDQHEQFLQDKNETLHQRETFDEDQAGRKLKNRVVVVPKKEPEMNHPISITEQEKKESMHSVKNAIESHHTQTTNKGYSRKPDGGFFTS